MNDASNIGLWVMAGSQVLGFVWVLFKLSGRAEKREIQQPLEVKAHEQFAPLQHQHAEYMTKADCRAFHADNRAADAERFHHIHRQLEAFTAKLDGSLSEHNKAAEARANALHGRISDLVPAIAKVEGRLNDHLENHRSKTHVVD